MNKIKINIHSYIDIITNSSTEIYVSADESTIDSIKQLVDSILKAGGSDKRFDDLFEIGLYDDDEDEEDDDEYYDRHPTCEVICKSKLGDKDSAIAASILSDLTGLFGIDAEYDG